MRTRADFSSDSGVPTRHHRRVVVGAPRWFAAIAAIGMMGCIAVVVPERRTTSKIVRVETSPLIVGPAGGFAISAAATGARIDVLVERHRSCHRLTSRVLEQRKKRVAKVESGVVDLKGATGPGILLWMAAMPVVFAISGVVTSVVVAVDGTEVSRTREHDDREQFACRAQAPATRIEVALPSGALLSGTSDAFGRWTFMIPISEPTEGDITVRALGAPGPVAMTLHYDAGV